MIEPLTDFMIFTILVSSTENTLGVLGFTNGVYEMRTGPCGH